MTEEKLRPKYYVIVYPMGNGRWCVVKSTESGHEHATGTREEITGLVESALQAAEEAMPSD